jgi:ATP-dependent Clp protease adapter protein ClpS
MIVFLLSKFEKLWVNRNNTDRKTNRIARVKDTNDPYTPRKYSKHYYLAGIQLCLERL